MFGFFRLLLILLVVAVIGGGIFLMSWDIPAPQYKVEKEISHDAKAL